MSNKLYRMEEVGKLVKDNFPADSVNSAYIHSETLYRKCEDGQEFTNKLYPILLDTIQKYVETANELYDSGNYGSKARKDIRRRLEEIIYELELLVTTIMEHHLCSKTSIRTTVDDDIENGYGYEKQIILDKRVVDAKPDDHTLQILNEFWCDVVKDPSLGDIKTYNGIKIEEGENK